MKIESKEGTIIELDKNGSLGLLALGDVGLEIWKKLQEEEDQIHEVKKDQ